MQIKSVFNFQTLSVLVLLVDFQHDSTSKMTSLWKTTDSTLICVILARPAQLQAPKFRREAPPVLLT